MSDSFLSPLGVSLFHSFLDSLDDWQTGTLYGHPLPRVSASGSPRSRTSTPPSAGPTSPTRPSCSHVQSLLTAHTCALTVDRRSAVPLTTCLVNKYRGGTDSMGKHSDDEGDLGPQPSIASVNIGQARTFCMARRDAPEGGGKRKSVKFELCEGSVLLMSGRTQEEWVHWVPKQPERDGVRYNLTFRPWANNESAESVELNSET